MEAEREANKQRMAEEAAKAKEQKRLDDRLLNTYSSEKDIDDARERSLKENEAALKETEKRLDAAVKRQKALDKEKEFYAGKPLPAKLEQSMQDVEAEIKYQQESLELRRKQVTTINAKYDDDKRRYLEIMKRQAVATGSKK